MFITNSTTGATSKTYDSSITAFDSTWHHVAFTWDAGTLELYVDGVKDTSVTKTADNAVTSIRTTTAALTIGNGTNNFYFDGNIDEVAVWNTTLTDAQITAIYNSGTPNDLRLHSASANLQGFWKMGDLVTSFPTYPDASGNGNTGTATNMVVGDIETEAPGSDTPVTESWVIIEEEV